MGSISPYPPAPTTFTTANVLGYAEIATSVTLGAIGGEVDVTGLSVTVTVPEGRRIRVSGMVHLRAATASDVLYTRLRVDGNNLGFSYMNESATLPTTGAVQAVHTPAAGTHTYKVAVNRASGSSSVSVYAASGETSYIMVEDITGQPSAVTPASVPVGLLGQATNSADQTLTTIVDLTNLSVNVTVPAGRSIKISGELSFSSSISGDLVDLYIYQDGVTIKHREWRSNVANVAESAHIEVVASPSAGAHIYKLVMARGFGATGTITVTGTGDRPGTIYVEDISPTPAPANSTPSSTLDYKESQADSGTITTNANISGLSSTVTVAAGRRIRVSFKGEVRGTTGDVWVFAINEGATALQRQTGKLPGTASETVEMSVVLSPSAASHTYVVNLALGSGTGVIYGASSTYPGYLLVEDITGVGVSGHTHSQLDDPGWIAPTLTNGWLNYDTTTYSAAGYRKIGSIVYLRGLVKSGTVGAGSGAYIFTLPVGFRPPKNLQLICATTATQSASQAGYVEMMSDGGVRASTGSNTWWSLETLWFFVD